jgi:hypothetical protein
MSLSRPIVERDFTRSPAACSLFMSVYNYSINPKVTHMMHIDSAKHVQKTNHENNVLPGSQVEIAVLTGSRMYHIPEYVPNVPMYLEHFPSDVPVNQAYSCVISRP